MLLHKIIIRSVSRALFLFICSPRSYALCAYTSITVINNGQNLPGNVLVSDKGRQLRLRNGIFKFDWKVLGTGVRHVSVCVIRVSIGN